MKPVRTIDKDLRRAVGRSPEVDALVQLIRDAVTLLRSHLGAGSRREGIAVKQSRARRPTSNGGAA